MTFVVDRACVAKRGTDIVAQDAKVVKGPTVSDYADVGKRAVKRVGDSTADVVSDGTAWIVGHGTAGADGSCVSYDAVVGDHFRVVNGTVVRHGPVACVRNEAVADGSADVVSNGTTVNHGTTETSENETAIGDDAADPIGDGTPIAAAVDGTTVIVGDGSIVIECTTIDDGTAVSDRRGTSVRSRADVGYDTAKVVGDSAKIVN
jgi:hypothetical protein